MDDFKRELKEKCPQLFALHCCLDCGSGWHGIILELSLKLEAMITAHIADFVAEKEATGMADDIYWPHCVQCKEKYATLRFYMSVTTDEMDDAIDIAEAKSAQTCERCGEPGQLRQLGSWYSTLCEECFINKNASYKSQE